MAKKKKICFVATTPMTLKAFVLRTACYLHDNGGYDVTFVSSYDKKFKNDLPSYIRYYPIDMSRGINFDCFRVIKKMTGFFKRENFDIIQYSTPNASFYASIAGRRAHTKTRLYCQWGIRYVGFDGLKRKVFKKIERIICRNSTWIEPDSFGNLSFSHKEGLYDEKNSSVVWNGSASGVDLDRFNRSKYEKYRSRVRKELDLGDCIVIGFIGRLERDKGVNELLESVRNLEKQCRIKLLLVGPEEKNDTIDQDLYNWAKNSTNVVFAGMVDDVEKYYAAMDIFVLPSYREGFGSVVIEAEAMGLPVVVTDIPGPTDAMLADKTGVVVKKGDIVSLVNGLKKLINNEELRRKYSLNAIEFVSDNFDEKILHQYILQDRDRLVEKNEK